MDMYYNEECILHFERDLKKVKKIIMKEIAGRDIVSVET